MTAKAIFRHWLVLYFFMSCRPHDACPAGACAPTPCTSSDSVTLPAFSNSQRERHLVALLERILQIHQHQVIAARRELDGLAGLDRQSLVERTHGHDAVVHGHLVDLDLAGEIAGAADQPVRRRALVLDGEIAARDLGAAGRRAAPGLRDDEIAGLDLLGARGRGQSSAATQASMQASMRCNVLHGPAFVFQLSVQSAFASGGYLPSYLMPAKTALPLPGSNKGDVAVA